jgi:SAM-dependent methyltransferase
MKSKTIEACLCCGSRDLVRSIDLGSQPPANSYRKDKFQTLEIFPLALNRCVSCWHSQLSFSVDRSEIFDTYSYVSGTSNTLRRFFQWFSKRLRTVVPKGGRVLELACNDGSLLKEMISEEIKCVGVDPAANLCEIAEAAHLPIVHGYWPAVADRIDGRFDAIICMNVLAHVDDPLSFLVGCKEKLTEQGVILIQPSQVRMFENSEFDTIYHEHISFFNTRSISCLAERAGLKLTEAFLVRVHGDSPVYVLTHKDCESSSISGQFVDGEFGMDENLFDYELSIRLFSGETYQRFAKDARRVLDCLRERVLERRKMGDRVAFVGAAAKAMTVVNAAGIEPDCFLDENPMKIGLYAPGCDARIESLESVADWKEPTFFIISAWNFRRELAGKLRSIGIPPGSSIYSYFPREEHL